MVLFDLLERLSREEKGVWEAIDQSVAELNGNLDGLDDFLNQAELSAGILEDGGSAVELSAVLRCEYADWSTG